MCCRSICIFIILLWFILHVMQVHWPHILQIRNQKDVFVEYSSYFLSSYIYTYSGFGPLKTGIKRSVSFSPIPCLWFLHFHDKYPHTQTHWEKNTKTGVVWSVHDHQVNYFFLYCLIFVQLKFNSRSFPCREIDEALRPGVYSLIDICSKADFQRLHTSLGG